MTVLAAIRPDDWNLPLLLHVLGAMLLVGGIATAATAQLIGWRRRAHADALTFARASFRSLLFVAFPSWFLMRFAGGWIAEEEGFGQEGGNDPAWIDIGFITSEGGGFLLLIAIVLAGLGLRRLRRTGSEASSLARAAGVLATILLAVYVVAVWAMTTKPG